MRSFFGAALAVALTLSFASTASAQIYKYTDSDGNAVYTDSLAELPSSRRSYYAERRRKLEAARRELERTVGKEELERREAEKKKEELRRKKMDEAERARRMAIIDAQLKRYKKAAAQEKTNRKQWQARVATARSNLKRYVAEYKKAKDQYTGLAIRSSHTLLPGQAKTRDDAKKKMKALEASIDATIEELEVRIPAEAKKAGVPPGWIR